MQTYFDQTRKRTSQQNGRPHKKKMEDNLKKMEENLKKNGRQTNQPKST